MLERLAQRNVYAITSFIFGLDHDTAGSGRADAGARCATWPPVLPVFGQITPFPATPLYDRLVKEGRLTRPKHWLEFAPFHMAHTPLKHDRPRGAGARCSYAWSNAYSPEATAKALDSIANEPVPYKISHLVSRLFFRGHLLSAQGRCGAG